MNSPTRRAVIYTRISKDDSGEGASNQRQLEACEKLADLRGWNVVGVEEDIAISAYSGRQRPAWKRVLGSVEAGDVDMVIAWHMDRMTRSMSDLEDLILIAEKNGVGIATVSGDIDLTNDMGRMIARILAAVARQEVERKSARQRSANRQRATAGKPWGSGWRAFGYSIDGDVIPDEAEAYRLAFDDVLAGKLTMRELARRWTDQGFSGRNDAESATGWTHRGVRFALTNPRYAGISTYLGEEVGEGNWVALVTRSEHIQMKALLTDPSRRTNDGRGGRTARTLLSGIAACEKCATTVTGGPRQGRAVYRCKRDCVGPTRVEADAYVLSGIETALRIVGPTTLFGRSSGPKSQIIPTDVSELARTRGMLTRSLGAGIISQADWEVGVKELNDQIAEAERLTSHEPRSFGITTGAEDAITAMHELPLARQRELVRSITQVTFKPKGRGRRNVPIRDQIEVWFPLGDEAVSLEALRAETVG